MVTIYITVLVLVAVPSFTFMPHLKSDRTYKHLSQQGRGFIATKVELSVSTSAALQIVLAQNPLVYTRAAGGTWRHVSHDYM